MHVTHPNYLGKGYACNDANTIEFNSQAGSTALPTVRKTIVEQSLCITLGYKVQVGMNLLYYEKGGTLINNHKPSFHKLKLA
jgi:hypothetical protein